MQEYSPHTWQKGRNLETSIKYAMAGAAISTTRFGTSPSMPEENEIEKFYREFFWT